MKSYLIGSIPKVALMKTNYIVVIAKWDVNDMATLTGERAYWLIG